MNTMNHDDPRLTAYALGELPESERAAVEALIERDPAAKQQVEEIRGFADRLTKEFQSEAGGDGDGLDASQRARILDAGARRGPSRTLRIVVSLGAAASVVLAGSLALRQLARNELPASDVKGTKTLADSRSRDDAAWDELAKRGAVAKNENGAPETKKVESSPEGSAVAGKLGADAPNAPPPAEPAVEAKEQLRQSGYQIGYLSGQGRPTTGGGGGPAAPGGGPGGAGGGPAGGRVDQAKPTASTLTDSLEVDRKAVPEGEEVEVQDAVRKKDKESDSDGFAKRREQERSNTEAYAAITENEFRRAASDSLSTFSIDVDTASYSNSRRFLTEGQLPPASSIRIEEFINYFHYDYPQPDAGQPFSATTEVARCPWKPDHRLVLVGLNGKSVDTESRKPANLVFLIDVSGSMNSPDRLPLVIRSMKMFVEQLDHRDRIAMVVYAGSTGLVLPSTSGDQQGTIAGALDRLQAGGSTNGGAGIELAYKTAQENFLKEGNNRVVLATDGDFNVGVTDRGSLLTLIEEKRKSGVFLSVLGFGRGNLKDETMELLADKGNGNYAYVDSLKEAQKVLVDQVGGTLETIAKDVKIQVMFNPAQVEAWRLIGYENRVLAHQDFNDDTKDAGEIGAGISVTAMYEVVPKGVAIDLPKVDPNPFVAGAEAAIGASDALMLLRLRWKAPDSDTSELMETTLKPGDGEFRAASMNLRFAASVAGFGMLLKGSKHAGDLTLGRVRAFAAESLGADAGGWRAEFLTLVDRALELKPEGR